MTPIIIKYIKYLRKSFFLNMSVQSNSSKKANLFTNCILLKNVIINNSLVTRTDKDGVQITKVTALQNTKNVESFTTKSNMIVICADGETGETFRCMYSNCYLINNKVLESNSITVIV